MNRHTIASLACAAFVVAAAWSFAASATTTKPTTKPLMKPSTSPTTSSTELSGDLGRIQGNWTVKAAYESGHPWADDMKRATHVTIKGEKMSVDIAGDDSEISTLKLDDSKSPHRLDVTGVFNGQQSRQSGIYQIDSDTQIELCWSKPGDKRPDSFDIEAGSRTTLLVLTRAESKAGSTPGMRHR